MNYQSIWDDQHRKEAWDLMIDVSNNLKIPLSPTLSTAINYIHYYFEISGKLDLPLFQIAILAIFVASKTQETVFKADDLIDAFVTVGLQRDANQLKILGTNIEFLDSIKNQDTENYSEYRKMFLDSELDFMTAMKWKFPNHDPFHILKKWFNDLKNAVGNEDYDSISNQLNSSSTNALCFLIVFPDSLYTKDEDLVAAAFEYAWQQMSIQTHWSTIINYNTSNETFSLLLNRLKEFNEQSVSTKNEQ
ncbi:hypothetical protein M9Y10_043789 [Tritrichomonas musculus]|uniref:Cyclin N-terminal domain-containing protein n=1 Tax=Tritrichomonas musculus TaxID=1915356 RepID=A0ABR2K120_9EUKA